MKDLTQSHEALIDQLEQVGDTLLDCKRYFNQIFLYGIGMEVVLVVILLQFMHGAMFLFKIYYLIFAIAGSGGLFILLLLQLRDAKILTGVYEGLAKRVDAISGTSYTSLLGKSHNCCYMVGWSIIAIIRAVGFIGLLFLV